MIQDSGRRCDLDKETYLTALHKEAAALAAAARLGLTEAVPTCPGWSVADLVLHTGAVHRAQANLVATHAQEPVGLRREMLDSVPGLLPWFERSTLAGEQTDLDAIPAGLIPWFEEGAVILESVLREADMNEPVWSWSGNNRVAHYVRMMPIETAVHRWDAQSAHGQAEPIDLELAEDGISQTFEVMLPFRRTMAKAPAGSGERYLFRQSDGSGKWLVRFDPEVVEVEAGQETAGVMVRGPASDLFLFLWGRIPVDRLEVEGDAALLDRYFELVPPV